MDDLYIQQAMMSTSTSMNVMELKGEPSVEQYNCKQEQQPIPPTPVPVPVPVPSPQQQDPQQDIIQDLQQQLYESKQTQEEYKIRVQRLMELVEKQATIISTLQQQLSSRQQQQQ
ncbi:predicted protein [Lichtheimia corymbifera JMRC:FSU:9682]|uniref:Uncharacterized protein n=1 Tax=Lichtheimia corymbifera JMRC:FSU:9682 TaxID=1263082 RepID=A0A068RWC9_9FUNG|nr:predicted protein [Lichtheimia corymbifera JMRC:FSU:9682]